MARAYVLTLDCPDRPGIVHAVTGYLLRHGANITESQQYEESVGARFFLRMVFDVPDDAASLDELRASFTAVSDEFAMQWNLWDATSRYRTLILVSRAGHCLNDLLYRVSTGSLNIEVPAVVSNHRDLEPLARSYGVDFAHLPVTPETKAEAETQLLSMVEALDIDLVVLARYMQILSDDACRALAGMAINIHHSFLPGFKGARPYHQAHQRGVKLIGATAHYVTSDLDEGPIIEQDVIRVDHRMTAAQLAEAGRDVECQVLARAVRWHADTRVLADGHRTVVFR
jgi:formyltetrahydrofolate deformylase